MTDWFARLKSKVNDIKQKLTSPVEFRHPLNFKLVFFLIIIIAIAVVVVFTQYPQVLRSFAKPSQSICGSYNTRCCTGDLCNIGSGLQCYAPDDKTAKKCTTINSVCGSSADKPCCISGTTAWGRFCNASLTCKNIDPQFPYQNPWGSGMCALSYDSCGGRGEACCYNDGDANRCDQSLYCIGNTINETCDYASIHMTLANRWVVGSPVPFYVYSNLADTNTSYDVNCGNGDTQSGDSNTKFMCTYNSVGTYTVTANINGTAASSTSRIVIYPNITSTPGPVRRPTPTIPGSWPTPTSVPPTSSYTCSGTCLPNGEDCYREAGWGSCPSGKFCCQTIDPPPVATPTTRPPNTPVPPTKVPTGGYCNSNSQCGSNNCCNNYCQPSNYHCPNNVKIF